MTLSLYQLRILRALTRGPLSRDTLRKLDQRPLRAMFLRRLFTLNRQIQAEITQAGWNVATEMQLAPAQRKNPNNPDDAFVNVTKVSRPTIGGARTPNATRRFTRSIGGNAHDP